MTIDQIVDKRYQLIKIISESWWGQTYLAKDIQQSDLETEYNDFLRKVHNTQKSKKS